MTNRQKRKALTAPLSNDAFEVFSRPLFPSVTVLVNWLNRGQERAGDKSRIASLLELLRQVDAEIVATGTEPLSSNGKRFRELEAEIGQRMECYTTKPRFRVDYGRRKIGAVHVWKSGAGIEEAQMLRAIEDMLDIGVLVMRCDNPACGKWFCRRKRNFRFCSDACRQTREESSEYRKQRKRIVERLSRARAKFFEWENLWKGATGGTKRRCQQRMQTAKQKRDQAQRVLTELERKKRQGEFQ